LGSCFIDKQEPICYNYSELEGGGPLKKVLLGFLKLVAILASISLTAVFLLVFSLDGSGADSHVSTNQVDVAIMDRFDMYMNNGLSDALQGILAIEKVYWLNDDDLVAPEPDQSKYGYSTDPTSLGWLLEDAQKLLDGQETLFNTDIQIAPGSQIIYYLDDTIFAVTWKQIVDGGMYTFSEVKLAHPSQLRRYLAGGRYDSKILQVTTHMAQSVNAVVASSGDFYANRRHGVIVYDGVVQRVNSWYVDTCYIDDKGDMLFSYAGELTTMEEAQKFVDENNIRFSMAFGPIIKDHDKLRDISYYALGQGEDTYPRAALCQKGDLHYVVAIVNREGYGYKTATIYDFANVILDLDVDMAYTLDGGQTAVLVMNDRMINAVLNGSQRAISDIFYFATAMPDGS